MRRFASLLMATSSLVVFAADAHAASPGPSWTGCYVGANFGFGRARQSYGLDPTTPFVAAPPDQSIDGVVGGGQAGCDYQFDPFVVGIQGIFDGTSMSGTGDPFTIGKRFNGTLKAQVPWLATLTGRVGYAFQPNILVYLKGGAAWARTEFDVFGNGAPYATANVTRTGWTLGGGFEWMFAPSWSLFVEYNHMDFGNRSETFTGVSVGTFAMEFKQDIDLVQVGVNYRFNWWR